MSLCSLGASQGLFFCFDSQVIEVSVHLAEWRIRVGKVSPINCFLSSQLSITLGSTHISSQYEPISSHFRYFGFVTMTTLGLGDMIPVGSLAKSLVVFQGMIELLYPVIMIARLVSMEVAHSTLG